MQFPQPPSAAAPQAHGSFPESSRRPLTARELSARNKQREGQLTSGSRMLVKILKDVGQAQDSDFTIPGIMAFLSSDWSSIRAEMVWLV